MAETDAGKVREALVSLTTQYQSQQIDAGFSDNTFPLVAEISSEYGVHAVNLKE